MLSQSYQSRGSENPACGHFEWEEGRKESRFCPRVVVTQSYALRSRHISAASVYFSWHKENRRVTKEESELPCAALHVFCESTRAVAQRSLVVLTSLI